MTDGFINKWSSQVKKGVLSYLVLSVLAKKEQYGYELIEEIKQFSKIEIAEGTLYPLLNRLKKEGMVDAKWVEQDSGIPRKYYHLTTSGKASLADMHKYWDDLNLSIKKLRR